MLLCVNNIAEFSDNTYGQRRIQKSLNSLNYPVGCKKKRNGLKKQTFGCVIKRSTKQQPAATTRNLYMIMNLNWTLMFNDLIKRGFHTLRIFGLQKDCYI